jgi:hypothetical protein
MEEKKMEESKTRTSKREDRDIIFYKAKLAVYKKNLKRLTKLRRTLLRETRQSGVINSRKLLEILEDAFDKQEFEEIKKKLIREIENKEILHLTICDNLSEKIDALRQGNKT